MAKLLTLLFEVTALFDMETRIELVLLQKTMVVVEGVARKLDPQLELVVDLGACGERLDHGEPRAEGTIEDAGRGAAAVAALVADAPRRLEAIAANLEALTADARPAV